jgi:hypothetical protein
MASQWFHQAGGKEAGPISGAELRNLAQRGVVTRETLVKNAPDAAWVPAEHVRGLFPVASAVPPPPPPAKALPALGGAAGNTPRVPDSPVTALPITDSPPRLPGMFGSRRRFLIPGGIAIGAIALLMVLGVYWAFRKHQPTYSEALATYTSEQAVLERLEKRKQEMKTGLDETLAKLRALVEESDRGAEEAAEREAGIAPPNRADSLEELPLVIARQRMVVGDEKVAFAKWGLERSEKPHWPVRTKEELAAAKIELRALVKKLGNTPTAEARARCWDLRLEEELNESLLWRKYEEACKTFDKEIASQEERVNRARTEKDLAERGAH